MGNCPSARFQSKWVTATTLTGMKRSAFRSEIDGLHWSNARDARGCWPLPCFTLCWCIRFCEAFTVVWRPVIFLILVYNSSESHSIIFWEKASVYFCELNELRRIMSDYLGYLHLRAYRHPSQKRRHQHKVKQGILQVSSSFKWADRRDMKFWSEPPIAMRALPSCPLTMARPIGAYNLLSYARNMQFESVSSHHSARTHSNRST
jgi:hypothetical protein